ncbi:MAG: hypothetical protein PHS99_09420 [Candidatus Marinimicrobia bacterium]|nr:hypothetical protein [Candidatus Neomarinimicrobiota bacterium]
MKTQRKAYPGIALTGIALVVIILFGMMGAFLLYISSSGGQSAAGFLNGHKAYYIANAGIEYAMNELFATDTIIDQTINYDDGSFTKTLSSINDSVFLLKSEGNIGKYSRTLKMYYKISGSGSQSIYVEENIVVHTTHITFQGNTLTGPNCTAIIEGGFSSDDINGGATLAVSNLYFDGDVNLDGGSASLGSQSAPGAIYVNGNLTLWSGGRSVYGDIYVNGNFALKDAKIYGDVYVNGNVNLGWTPTLATDSYINYTGSLTYPDYYDQSILNKCIHVASVPGFEIPTVPMPQLREPQWYVDNGYLSSGTLGNNLKIYAPSYSSTSWISSANNVVIVASQGDITITGLGGSSLSGFLFAPYGKVTFSGGSFEGTVIARDGFFVTSGGTTANMVNLDTFFSSPSQYPFVIDGSSISIVQISE